MKLSKIKLKGFRNFKNATINFNEKTLIIGANDVGKTNLLWAIRILLDRSLNDYDIEPKESDFYAYDDTNEFEISLFFDNVTEDAVVSKLKGYISDDDKLILSYKATRDTKTAKKTYKLFAGHKIDGLEEIEDRFYRKVLNVKYIGSRRDLNSYINREKNYLFEIAKENREQEEVDSDDKLLSEIQTTLKEDVDKKIPDLNFISKATLTINEELKELSIHHKKQEIVFDTNASNIDKFINNVSIASKYKGKNILIGGDGRLNQIYLALWAAKNELKEEKIEEFSIICIEEPEAHLHPHQQRKLAEYLNKTLKGQVILTTHSPQITTEFSPNSIIRMLNENGATRAASGGCSKIIDEAFSDFGYRMSIIPAEAFYSDVVLLVEGASEELFYKTLAKQLGIDLDRLNISIMMVDGIGFKPFIDILNSLEIEWVLRTDNDVFKIKNKELYRFAGIQRGISYYKDYFVKDDKFEKIIEDNEQLISSFTKPIPAANIIAANRIKKELNEFNIYIAEKDLENDLFNSEIKEDLEKYFPDSDDIIGLMQKRKATFMYDFLKNKKNSLKKLKGNNLALPLFSCVEIIERIQNEAD